MHEPVKERLEEYLHGSPPSLEVEEHLRNCPGCREEVEAMRMQTLLLRDFKSSREVEPAAGFYGRVMGRIDSQPRPSAWTLFGESLFAQRLAYASAAFLILLGSFFISSTETAEAYAASDPEAILAGHEAPEPVSMEDPQRDREAILVNLATYEQQDYQ